MIEELEARFDEAIMDVYRRALKECDYKATRFLHMLHEHRGLETARILLHAPGVSEGYIALWERKRLDLTVEAVMLGINGSPCSRRRSGRLRESAWLNMAVGRRNSRAGSCGH